MAAVGGEEFAPLAVPAGRRRAPPHVEEVDILAAYPASGPARPVTGTINLAAGAVLDRRHVFGRWRTDRPAHMPGGPMETNRTLSPGDHGPLSCPLSERRLMCRQSRAMDLNPDLVISAGNELVDPLALVTANHLDQQFLVVGAELAEPTATSPLPPGPSPPSGARVSARRRPTTLGPSLPNARPAPCEPASRPCSPATPASSSGSPETGGFSRGWFEARRTESS